MGTATSIEWTDATWNPTTGCDRISPGCDRCYALTLAKRLKAMGQPKYQRDGDPRTSGPGFGLSLHEDALEMPRRWAKPRRIFVNSMSDLFHAQVPPAFIGRVFEVMNETPRHQYQVLTKRALRASRLAERFRWTQNIWMGTSVENAEQVARVEHLRAIPAHIRFLSVEPLLGPLGPLDLTDIHWVIAGGESGAHHRPVHIDWLREVRDQCLAQSVPFFFKQWGGHNPRAGGRQLDGVSWDQLPLRAAALV
jgi:protein gp37